MKKIWSIVVSTLYITGVAFGQSGTTIASGQPGKTTIRHAVDSEDQIVHVLNRLTFGPRPGDIDRVKEVGVKSFIEAQLNPESINESNEAMGANSQSPDNEALVQQFKEMQKERQQQKKQELAQEEKGLMVQKNPDQAGKGDYLKAFSIKYASNRLARDVQSERQLQEVMTEFWFNHFNISINKGMDKVLVGPYMDQAIRPYALGKFRDLLGATCHHPAMMFYLDNWQNSVPSAGPKGKTVGLNENYARELMELHTLGVDGGYTQKDVIELARILTGLGLAGPRKRGLQPVGPYGVFFAENRHDFGEKVLLGQRIAGSGEEEIEHALDMLVRHPSTAHHISYQLAQYFVCDNPPPSLVDKLAERFTRTDGNIKEVLRELFNSNEFWDPKFANAKYKSPLRYAVSALRASDAHPQSYLPIIQFLRMQGEPIYACLTPDGYKNTKAAWLNPDGLLYRINFATALAAGKLPAVLPNPADFKELGNTISDGKFSSKTVDVVMKAPDPLKAAIVLGSPEFMNY